MIQPHLPAFLTRYPHVKLQIIALDRPVDLIHERIDIALRVRTELTSDADLIMRTLGVSHRILVASPTLAARLSDDIDTLNQWPTLGTSDEPGELTAAGKPSGERRLIKHEPRMSCGDFLAVRAAAVSGRHRPAAGPQLHRPAEQRRAGAGFRPRRGQAGIVHLVLPRAGACRPRYGRLSIIWQPPFRVSSQPHSAPLVVTPAAYGKQRRN